MKICIVTDDFNSKTGGQFTAIKEISSQLKNNKIRFLIIDKNNFQKKKNFLNKYVFL